jgi:hypothetical protein
LEASLCQIPQVLRVTLFEETPILRALQASLVDSALVVVGNQLNLFAIKPDSSCAGLAASKWRNRRPTIGRSIHSRQASGIPIDPEKVLTWTGSHESIKARVGVSDAEFRLVRIVQ